MTELVEVEEFRSENLAEGLRERSVAISNPEIAADLRSSQ